MKFDSVVCGVVLAAGFFSFRAQADPWDKKTILTVKEPIQVRDRVLEPGQYTLKLFSSSSTRNVVQIFNGDQTRLVDTVMAIPKYRMEPAGKTELTFWETPAGKARALRAWFYPGDTIGQEFPYPAHLKQLAMAQQPGLRRLEPAPTTAVTLAATSTEAPAAPGETPAAEPPEPVRQTASAQQPVQMAQNFPPPPAPSPAPPADTAPRNDRPAELPRTASPYPLIGLCGLLSLGLYTGLRLTRPV